MYAPYRSGYNETKFDVILLRVLKIYFPRHNEEIAYLLVSENFHKYIWELDALAIHTSYRVSNVFLQWGKFLKENQF